MNECRSLERGHPSWFVAKVCKSDGVTLAQGDIRQQQDRVQAVIKVREFIVFRQHAMATVEQEDDLLITLVLVFP
jgi:hypothetical protein